MNLSELTQLFNNAGGTTYAVGGFPRDLLLELEPKDIDLVVFNLPVKDFQKIIKQTGAKPVGNQFPIAVFQTQDWGEVEVALPRKEISTGDDRSDFDVVCDPYMSVKEDAVRRDLTINAIYMDLDREVLIDPTGGMKHIESKLLVPVAGFSEDHTRVLRAFRFALTLGFDLSRELVNELFEMEVRPFTKEMLGKELTKLAKGWLANEELSHELFDIFCESGWLEYIFPEFRGIYKADYIPSIYHMEPLKEHTIRVTMNALQTMDNPVVALISGIMHDSRKPEVQRWNEEKERIQYIGHERFSQEYFDRWIDANFVKSDVVLARKICQNHMKIHNKLAAKTLWRVMGDMGNTSAMLELFKFGVADTTGRTCGKISKYGNLVVDKDHEFDVSHIEFMKEVIEAWDIYPKTDGKILIKSKKDTGKPIPQREKFGEALQTINYQEFRRVYTAVEKSYGYRQ